jgi:hypothetical protein
VAISVAIFILTPAIYTLSEGGILDKQTLETLRSIGSPTYDSLMGLNRTCVGFAIFTIYESVILLTSGIGMLKFKNWARLLLFGNGLLLMFILFFAIIASFNSDRIISYFAAVSLGILFLYYLNIREVKSVFK